MTLAYCPAFDFDPEATKMTFDQILEILKSPKTDYQKAADLHAALTAIPAPSSLNMQPQKKRKSREKKPRQEVVSDPNNFEVVLLNGADHEKAS
jgi:hypothetical protein